MLWKAIKPGVVKCLAKTHNIIINPKPACAGVIVIRSECSIFI